MKYLNFFLRTIIQLFFCACSWLIRVSNWNQRKKFQPQQRALREKWQVGQLPVASFEQQQTRLMSVFDQLDSSRRWVQTSGTKNVAKQIPYDSKRIKSVQKEYMRAMITLTSMYTGHKTFFAMASLDEDNSLTSGMINQKSPHHLELLQAPYRFLQTTEGKELRKTMGDLTARIILLIVTQPRFVYATNPSTISHFIRSYESAVLSIKLMIRTLLKQKRLLGHVLKLQDGDGLGRLTNFAESGNHLPVRILFPKLQAFITWHGGYVAPFLEQIKEKLPLISLVPMYSMSTEVIETLPHRVADKLHFLPTGKGVLYEFMDGNGSLHSPHELMEGGVYTLIISDQWGMRRYDTQDIFLVKDLIGGVPDLEFIKRRGLTVSLTGEKLTEEQVQYLKQKMDQVYPEFKKVSLSLYPIKRGEELGYELTVIGTQSHHLHPQMTELLSRELLNINSELRSKIESGRLSPLNIAYRTEAEFAELMGKITEWESQFKILPLYDKIIQRTN